MNTRPLFNKRSILSLRKSSLALAVSSVLAVGSITPLLAAQGDALGNDFAVNSTLLANQENPSIAMDADGDFVVVWQGNGQDADNVEDAQGIYAQRYSANGNTAGSEFRVNAYTTDSQYHPVVAMAADGDFAVAWQSLGQDKLDFDAVYVQRFNADGSKAGTEFSVNPTADYSLSNPAIAMDASGDFVVVWQHYDGDSQGVYGQRYHADGTSIGSIFKVNTNIVDAQTNPAVAMDADGDFVVTWQSYAQDGSGWGIYAQRYNREGAAVGAEFLVNDQYTTSHQEHPSVAMNVDGDFAIAWQSNNTTNLYDIAVRLYRQNATIVSTPSRPNTIGANQQILPTVVMDPDSNFMVAWQSYAQEPGLSVRNGVYARRYTPEGTPLGDGEFLVNWTTAALNQQHVSAAMNADGGFAMAWEHEPVDGSFDIYARRYEGAGGFIDMDVVINDEDPVTIGVEFNYRLIISNNGDAMAMDVNLAEPLPTGLSYVSDDAASSAWTCSVEGADLNCNKPFMRAGDVSVIDVTVKADITGSISNTVSVSTAQVDTNANNNADTETTYVSNTPDVAPSEGDTPADGGGGGGALDWLTLLLLSSLVLIRLLPMHGKNPKGEKA